MKEFLEKTFKLSEAGTNIRTEVRGGAVTFMTMAYIIFVQPAVLGMCGMDQGAVMMATCISAAIGTILMGLLANYPIALAPAMGENFIFVFVAVPAISAYLKNNKIEGVEAWHVALTVILVSGLLFLLLSLWKFREKIMSAIPTSLRHAIAAGIGLLITFVGLEMAGFKISSHGLPDDKALLLRNSRILVVFGLMVIGIMMSRKIRGAILIGMFASAIVGVALNVVTFEGVFSRPPSIGPTLFKFSFKGLFTQIGLEMIFVFFLLDLFDTVGTLVAVGHQANLVKEDGSLPRAGQAFISDALATCVGACAGTSTVTSYIESSSGVAEGARTGLANMVTGALFLLAIFFQPLVLMVGGGPTITNELICRPVIAPVLIIIGALIMQSAKHIKWDDPSESIPSFLTLTIMPLMLSITDGIAAGFMAYAVLKLLSGKGREVSPILYVFAVVFAIRGCLTLFGAL